MPTASPAEIAAAPILIEAFTDLKACLTTILTGDPAQALLRAGPAVQILNGQVTLLLPALAAAEQPVVLQSATGGIDAIITKLQSLSSQKSP